MKFKCNISGCVYNFESALDIKAMHGAPDYTPVPDEPLKEAPPVEVPVVPATIVQVKPVKEAPVKPLPVVPAAPKAV